MSLLIILSGPKTNEQQARTALAVAGFIVRPDQHAHGLPDRKDGKVGKRTRQAVSFITVEGDEPTEAREAVKGLGYELRLHREMGPSPEPSLADVLAQMRAEIDELKSIRGAV